MIVRDHDADDEEWDDDLDEDETTEPCPGCGVHVYEDAERCPYCGQYLSREACSDRKPWWVVLGALACLAMVTWWILHP